MVTRRTQSADLKGKGNFKLLRCEAYIGYRSKSHYDYENFFKGTKIKKFVEDAFIFDSFLKFSTFDI